MATSLLLAWGFYPFAGHRTRRVAFRSALRRRAGLSNTVRGNQLATHGDCMAVLDTAFEHLVAPRVARSSPRTGDHDRRSPAASRRRPARQQGGARRVVAVR